MIYREREDLKKISTDITLKKQILSVHLPAAGNNLTKGKLFQLMFQLRDFFFFFCYLKKFTSK